MSSPTLVMSDASACPRSAWMSMDVITATIVVCEEGWVTQASQAVAAI